MGGFISPRLPYSTTLDISQNRVDWKWGPRLPPKIGALEETNKQGEGEDADGSRGNMQGRWNGKSAAIGFQERPRSRESKDAARSMCGGHVEEPWGNM